MGYRRLLVAAVVFSQLQRLCLGHDDEDFFASCGKEAFCYGFDFTSHKLSADCWVSSSCWGAVVVMLPLYNFDHKSHVHMKFDDRSAASGVHWMAFGISTVRGGMKDMLVFECIRIPGDKSPTNKIGTQAFVSYANGKAAPKRLRGVPTSSGIVVETFDEKEKYLFCDFKIPATRRGFKLTFPEFGQKHFSLGNATYYLNFAFGGFASGNESNLSLDKHKHFGVSNKQFNLTHLANADDSNRNRLQNLHSCLNTIVFLGLLPTGMIMARFFRETWVEKGVVKKRIWFVVHVSLTITSLILYIIAQACIAVDTSDLIPHNWNPKFHAIIGYTAGALLLSQNLTPWVSWPHNCHHGHSIIHAFSGNLCLFLGVFNIGMAAVWLPRLISCWSIFLTIMWTTSHLSVLILLTTNLLIHDYILENHNYRALFFPMRLIGHVEGPGKRPRVIFLWCEIVICIIFVSAMIGIILYNGSCDRYKYETER